MMIANENYCLDDELIKYYALFTAALVLILSIVRSSWNKSKSKHKLIAPQSPFTFLETVKQLSTLKGHKMLQQCMKEVGPIFRLPLNNEKNVVCVGDIEIIRDVLGDRNVQKTVNYKTFRFIHGGQNDILTSEGSYHTFARKGMAYAFSSNHIKRMREVSIKHTDKFIHKINNKLNNNNNNKESFDISVEMLSLTFDIIMEAAFQYEMSHEEKEQFLEEIELVLKECYKERIPFRRKLGRLIPSFRRAKQAQTFMRKTGMNIIKSYRNLQPEDIIKGTVLDTIMNNNKAYKNDEERVPDVIMLLLGGHETTAFSLAWTFIELALHPEIQNELRLDLLNKKTLEECSKSKKLESIIKESQRLHPVTALGGSRVTQKDYYSIDKENGKYKYFIPKNTNLMLPPIVYFMNEEYFHDPYKFIPSRWEEGKEEQRKLQDKAFLPFSLGRRNCIGQSLAIAELYSIVPRIIQEFKLNIKTEGTDEFFLTLKPKGWYLTAKPCT